MLSEGIWLYVIASLLLLAGHVIRAARWALLFPNHRVHRRFDLLLGLAIGYTINAIIPWRLGEIARIWFVARRESLQVSYVATTVVAERLTDLIVVSAIAILALANANHNFWPIPLFPIGLSIALISLCLSIQRFFVIRRSIWIFASVFNDRIRFRIVDFFWTLSEIVVGGVLLKRRFLVTTLGMWCVYLLSYAAFAHASGQSVSEMMFTMIGSPLKPAAEQLMTGDRVAALTLLGFTGFPVIGILIYGGIKHSPSIMRLLNARRRYGWYASREAPGNARNRFKAEGEYEYFLVSLFSGDNKVATSFGLEAIDDGTVNRLFAGGSDAITALVEVEQRLLIRKFAVGAAGEKLKAQHDWLVNYRSDAFPLVNIVGDRQKAGFYHYDMPLVVPSNDFYDFIHTNSIDRSQRIMSEVIESVTAFHDRNVGATAEEDLVHKYLKEKAINNVSFILDFAKTIFPGDTYEINGTQFDWKQWNCLLDLEWMSRQIRERLVTVVHGDLTIENIIVSPQQTPNWYIIDPNPENVFNTRLIDWAKLMQSVHLGYEGLNRNFGCITKDNSIQLAFTKSQAYTELHTQLELLIMQRYGADGLREVYFHELVHYLRLTPYKIRHDPKKGVSFFACTSILLSRYLAKAIA